MNFNEAQLKAVKHGRNPMLVIAGPGSGKTTVLTMRVKNLIEEYKVEPSKILVITFTKASAMEMQERFNKFMGSRTRVTFGTFHAVFFGILKAAYNYSADNIIRPDKKLMILHQAVERSGLEPEDINEFISNIEGEISRVKTEAVDIDAYYSANCAQQEFRDIYKYYDKALKNSRMIDFDDMLLYCYELFVKRPDILAKWQQRYEYILIDEFQDINKIQYDIVKMLALPQNNLFIVGDDDQSIYGFRGSKPDIMLNFEKDFAGTEKVVLDTNYRSTGNIVKAAGLVIANNKVRFDKKIKTVNPEGDKVEITEFNNMNDEYQRVIDNIRKINADGQPYSDIAVLFRTNMVVVPLVRKLIQYNIPFILKDGIPNIFEQWLARDILTYMEMAHGSRKRSDFLQIMNKPLRYISRDYLTSSEISFDEIEKYCEEKAWLIERLDRMKADLAAMKGMPPYAAVNYLRKGVGYDDYLREYADKHSIEIKDLMNSADEIMESAKDCKTYEDWKKYIEAYSQSLKEGRTRNRTNDNAVILTTMHSSKGLEYDTVFIIDANEGVIPHKKASFDTEIEEERRMFYVAMTRAKKNLHIYYPKERYNKDSEVSRFVTEIMDEELK